MSKKATLVVGVLFALSPAVPHLAGPPDSPTAVLEVSVTDPDGAPVRGLTTEHFVLLENGEPRPLISARSTAPTRHILALVDLPTSPPKDRHLAMPHLRRFLLSRAARGDSITIATLRRRASEPTVTPLCTYTDDPELVDRALGRIESYKGAAFRAGRHRQTDDRHELRDAFGALEQAVALASGDGRSSLVLYLGRALATGISESTYSGTRVIGSRDASGPADTDTSNYTGSVQYLVSLPRSGPLHAKARGHGDRLLLAALEAETAVFPLIADTDSPGFGSESWLATETGGRPLSIRRLRMDLDRLAQDLDQTYQLTFEPATDDGSSLQSLQVDIARGSENLDIRHLRGYRPRDVDVRLDARARAAWRLESRDNPLRLDPRITHTTSSDSTTTALDLVLPAPSTAGSLTLSLAVPTAEGLISRRRRLPYSAAGTAESKTLRLRIPLSLPAGVHRLGLALRDDTAGAISAMAIDIE